MITMNNRKHISILLSTVAIIALSVSLVPEQAVLAQSPSAWELFKNNPCASGWDNGNGAKLWCLGPRDHIFAASIRVPTIKQIDQAPKIAMVNSVTGLRFNWELAYPEILDGHINRFDISLSPKEYYEDIWIHVYLFEMPNNAVKKDVNTTPIGINKRTYISLDEDANRLINYGYNSGIMIGDWSWLQNPDITINKYLNRNVPPAAKMDPSQADIVKFIKSTSVLPYVMNPARYPDSRWHNFEELRGAWFFSTISSYYATDQRNNPPYFRIVGNYNVGVYAWAEPRKHFKYGMIAPAQYGWYCQGVNLPSPIPPPAGCRPYGGSYNTGYWRYGKVREAEMGYIDIPVTPADMGGVPGSWGVLGRVPDFAQKPCPGCEFNFSPDHRDWAAPIRMYVYESQPLPSTPW